MAKSNSLIAALAAAVSGLLGVVTGAFVSGHYQLEAQRLAAQQSQNRAQYEKSGEVAQKLTETAARYLSTLSYLYSNSRNPSQIDDLDRRMLDLWLSSFELSLQTTIPTGQKIFDANVQVAEIMAAADDPDRQRRLEAKNKILGEVYLAIYADIARFRMSSGPNSARDELATTFMQLLLNRQPDEDEPDH